MGNTKSFTAKECTDFATAHGKEVERQANEFIKAVQCSLKRCQQYYSLPNDIHELTQEDKNTATFSSTGINVNIDSQTNEGTVGAAAGAACGLLGFNPGFWTGLIVGLSIAFVFMLCCCSGRLCKGCVNGGVFCCTHACWPFAKWSARKCTAACGACCCASPSGGERAVPGIAIPRDADAEAGDNKADSKADTDGDDGGPATQRIEVGQPELGEREVLV